MARSAAQVAGEAQSKKIADFEQDCVPKCANPFLTEVQTQTNFQIETSELFASFLSSTCLEILPWRALPRKWREKREIREADYEIAYEMPTLSHTLSYRSRQMRTSTVRGRGHDQLCRKGNY